VISNGHIGDAFIKRKEEKKNRRKESKLRIAIVFLKESL